jgi:hypothetical protein
MFASVNSGQRNGSCFKSEIRGGKRRRSRINKPVAETNRRRKKPEQRTGGREAFKASAKEGDKE